MAGSDLRSAANSSGYDYASMMNLPFVGLYDLNGDGLPDRVMLDETNIQFTQMARLPEQWPRL